MVPTGWFYMAVGVVLLFHKKADEQAL